MVIILSPAKNMNIRSFENFDFEKPIFIQEIEKINSFLNKLEPHHIQSIMKVNNDITLKTFANIKDFNINNEGHALNSYDGLVFKNIGVDDFTYEDIAFANKHLRILSGLYGVLSPLTAIKPYRLEMGCKLEIDDNKNLYKFWQDKIYKQIINLNMPIINLASKEYSKTITNYLKDSDKFINIDFLIFKNGKYKSVATSAKMARGQMTRYIIKNKITDVSLLKDFYYDIYQYNENLSSQNNLIFTN
nr:peroxide stress protein YaaA [uncultured Tyzzerella sp.]